MIKRHTAVEHTETETYAPAFARTFEDALDIPEGLHPVFDLIRRRRLENSTPGRRTDPHVLALAIEGGGMRGVLSAGMVLALEQFDTRMTFDRVYGSSAGSMMGAYFIARQATLAPSIYYQDLPNRTFISRRRFLGRKPVLNLDYLVDEVIESRKPLDYEAVLESPIELHVLASSIDSGESVDITGFRRKEELREAMRASARLPWLAGRPVTINGARCYDGGLTDSLAFTAALRGGATHVLALKTRADGGRPESFSQRQEWLMRHVLRVEPPAVELLLRRPERYESECRELARLAMLGVNESPQVYVVGPTLEDPTVSRLGRTRRELEVGGCVGITAVHRALGYPPPRIYEVLQPYHHPPR